MAIGNDQASFLLTADPCLNGGSCQDGVGSFSCSCLTGFAGPTCALDVDECLSSPCGPGTCTDHVASFTCTCPPGYGGFHCENDLPDCSPRWVGRGLDTQGPVTECRPERAPWAWHLSEGSGDGGICPRKGKAVWKSQTPALARPRLEQDP